MAKSKQTIRRETEHRLRDLARVATVFIDGDAFARIPLDPALNTGDDYAVDHESFLDVKQTLLKLKRLDDEDLGVTTWRPWTGEEVEQVCPVDLHDRQVRPGNHPITPAIAEALRGQVGVQQFELRGHPCLSVCAPIRDSMEDVVGVVELFASLTPDRFKVDQLDY